MEHLKKYLTAKGELSEALSSMSKTLGYEEIRELKDKKIKKFEGESVKVWVSGRIVDVIMMAVNKEADLILVFNPRTKTKYFVLFKNIVEI